MLVRCFRSEWSRLCFPASSRSSALRYAWSGTPVTRAAGLGISLLAVSALLPRLPVTQTAAIEQGSEATFIAGLVVLFLAFAAWARPHGPAH